MRQPLTLQDWVGVVQLPPWSFHLPISASHRGAATVPLAESEEGSRKDAGHGMSTSQQPHWPYSSICRHPCWHPCTQSAESFNAVKGWPSIIKAIIGVFNNRSKVLTGRNDLPLHVIINVLSLWPLKKKKNYIYITRRNLIKIWLNNSVMTPLPPSQKKTNTPTRKTTTVNPLSVIHSVAYWSTDRFTDSFVRFILFVVL